MRTFSSNADGLFPDKTFVRPSPAELAIVAEKQLAEHRKNVAEKQLEKNTLAPKRLCLWRRCFCCH